MFIEILKAILFGIVEGVTEWLPISSTGHMILVDQFIHLQVSDEFYKMFEVVIQLGAIMAVVLIFWNKLWPFCIKKVKRSALKNIGNSVSKDRIQKNSPKKLSKKVAFKEGALEMWIKIIIACIPAAIIGLLFDDKIDELFYHPTSVAIALIVVGVLFILVERYKKNSKPIMDSIDDLTYKAVVIIGMFQVLAAVFPGTSRSGATIIGALLIGVSRATAAEFTFFLAVPVMFGASLLKTVKYIATGVTITSSEIIILITGTMVAFIVSVFIIKFLMGYIKKHDFQAFGWYRIVLGILVLLIL